MRPENSIRSPTRSRRVRSYVAFFKISCPVCQFTFPFLERLYKTYKDSTATFWGVSQDSALDTKEFCEEYGVTFTVLLDDDDYTVSNLYGLTNVPTFFLIEQDGTATVSSVGFHKGKLEKIDAVLADHTHAVKAPALHARRSRARLKTRLRVQKLGSGRTYTNKKPAASFT